MPQFFFWLIGEGSDGQGKKREELPDYNVQKGRCKRQNWVRADECRIIGDVTVRSIDSGRHSFGRSAR